MDDLLYVLILGLIWLVVVVWGVCAETKIFCTLFGRKGKSPKQENATKKLNSLLIYNSKGAFLIWKIPLFFTGYSNSHPSRK